MLSLTFSYEVINTLVASLRISVIYCKCYNTIYIESFDYIGLIGLFC